MGRQEEKENNHIEKKEVKKMKDETYEIESEEEVRDNYTQIPNKVMHMGLSPYARTLYEQIRMTVRYGRAEIGVCYKTTKTLATECNMSMTSVIKAKKELEANKLIEILLYRENYTVRHKIMIKNIWKENYQFFEDRKSRSKYGMQKDIKSI